MLASWALGWGLLAAVIGVILSNWADEEHFLRIVQHAQPSWLLVAVGLQLGTYLSAAAIWRITLERFGVRIPMGPLVRLGFAKLFTDSLIPTGGVAGSLVAVRGLRQRGVPSNTAAAVLLVNVLGTYPALGLGLALATLVVAMHRDLGPAVLTVIAAFATVALVVPTLLLRVAGSDSRPDNGGWLRQVLGRVPLLRDLVRAMAEVPVDQLRDPVALLGASVLEIMILALDATTLLALVYALGETSTWLAVYAAFVIATVAGTVSVIPAGLGSFDAINVAILVGMGLPVEPALAATLLLRGITQWLPLLPGWLITRRELAHQAETIKKDGIHG